MATRLPWRILHDLKLSEVNGYVDDWKTTNSTIGDAISDVDDKVKPSIEAAFGALEDTEFADGATAALEHADTLAEQLDAAKTEGKAVRDTVMDAIDDLKSHRDKFADLVAEINDSKGPLESDGKFTVNLDEETIVRPPAPDFSQLDSDGDTSNSEFTQQEWRAACDESIESWTEDLNKIAADAFETDDEAARLLNGISANETKSFNADAEDAVEEASIKEQEEDAEEAADLLAGGEDGVVSEEELEEANALMEEHEGEEYFSTKLMNELGPDGLAEATGQISMEFGLDDDESNDELIDEMYKNLGNSLATATDPDNDTHVSDEWVDGFLKTGASQHSFPRGNQEWDPMGYGTMAPMLEHGNYDESFIVLVSEHIAALDEAGASWGGSNLDNVPPHLKSNPMNYALLGLEKNPEAAAEFFSENNSTHSRPPYPGEGGEGTVDPIDDHLTYVMESVGTDSGQLDVDIAGDAVETACTGVPAGTSPEDMDERPEHTADMVEVTQRTIDYVVEDPSRFIGTGSSPGSMIDNFGRITAAYAEDFYSAYLVPDAADADWAPTGPGGRSLDLGPYDPSMENSDVDSWMHLLGYDEDATNTAIGGLSAVGAEAIHSAADSSAEGGIEVQAASSGFARATGEIVSGQIQAIEENAINESKQELKTVVNNGAAYVAGKTPVLGDEVGFLTGKLLNWAMDTGEEKMLSEAFQAQTEIAEGHESAFETEIRSALESSADDLGISQSTIDIAVSEAVSDFYGALDVEPPK